MKTEGVSEPTLMIGEKTEEEVDEPTRMFTGDIGDFIKKREYEGVRKKMHMKDPSVMGRKRKRKKDKT